MNNVDYIWAEELVARGLAGYKWLNGYYHDNFVVDHGGVRYLVRVKKASARDMDFRQLEESAVLHYLQQFDFPAPLVYYESPAQNFSIHQYIDGQTLSELYPKHLPLPDSLITGIATNMAYLHELPLSAENFAGYVTDTQTFYGHVLTYVESFYHHTWMDSPDLFAENDFPAAPFAVCRQQAASLTERKAALLHADVHQHNTMMVGAQEKLCFVDWELALIGDPAHDLAVHINRSYYSEAQADLCIRAYLNARNEGHSFDAFRAQVGLYLDIECIRAAISDLYRLNKSVQRPAAAQSMDHKRTVRLPDLMQKARAVWARGES